MHTVVNSATLHNFEENLFIFIANDRKQYSEQVGIKKLNPAVLLCSIERRVFVNSKYISNKFPYNGKRIDSSVTRGPPYALSV